MKFDIIVIGAGHAGIEAAYAASKKNLSILLITGHLDLIGHMSCNPSIGGVSKGNIVREIDALGGTMAKNIDHTGIHFKMLNTSKGMAVWGNRAQADKNSYKRYARRYLEERTNIFLMQGFVKRILVNDSSVIGIEVDSGEKIQSKAVVFAMGTFLNGIIHIGLTSYKGGRIGEPSSESLTESINECGIKTGRLKTGTSPRLDGRTVNYEKFDIQKGDDDPWQFSFSTTHKIENKAVCWTSKTTSETHKIILDNLDKSPLYTGKINSIGPKYCPSVEDKIVRFGEREGHSLFLEPESIENSELYINGLSTSLPFDVQKRMVESVPGMENTKILRPGYGIEYDYFQPIQLKNTLESKVIENLYFAGQINGTSGYEEAAAQGLIAGINASQKILNEEPLVLGRETSYIGVLVDDLISKGTEEPYRMFTSRAEYRLLLRQDNCDERLMPIAYKFGLIEKDVLESRQRVWDKKKFLFESLEKHKIEIDGQHKIKISEFLKRPEADIISISKNLSIEEDIKLLLSIQADIKYSGFAEKEKRNIKVLNKIDTISIPENFDFESIKSILTESRKKLNKIKPQTLGQASRVPGITPSDIYNLAVYITNHHFVSRETLGPSL